MNETLERDSIFSTGGTPVVGPLRRSFTRPVIKDDSNQKVGRDGSTFRTFTSTTPEKSVQVNDQLIVIYWT